MASWYAASASTAAGRSPSRCRCAPSRGPPGSSTPGTSSPSSAATPASTSADAPACSPASARRRRSRRPSRSCCWPAPWPSRWCGPAACRTLRELRDLGPTIGFLAAVLVLAELCEREGLFEAAGHWMAGASMGRPVRLLSLVFAVGAAVTVVLSLDATVVLLTPVVFQTAARLRLRPKPQVYACTHLANSASLLLPVSNLTNLLAFRASGLSFVRFGALMWLPWLAAITVEWLALRSFFASDLVGRGTVSPEPRAGGAPRYAVAVLAVTLAGFGVASLLGVEEALVAALGALALAVPAGASLPALLAVAATAALLANLVNNLPAILLLLPAVSAAGPGPVLAALVGVNVGPNLTYVGSLATLLWRRALRARDAE